MQGRFNRESDAGRSEGQGDRKTEGILVANETVADYASLHTEDRREFEGKGGGVGTCHCSAGI